MLDRVELGAERGIDHAGAELDHEAADDRRIDLHIDLHVLVRDRRERVLDRSEVGGARLIRQRHLCGHLALLAGEELAEGTDHVAHREQAPVRCHHQQELGGDPRNAGAREHRGERPHLVLGREYRAAHQAVQIGTLGNERIEAVEIRLHPVERVLLERELEQCGRIAACHAGNDCAFACHVVSSFGQFRGLGTVADGGRQALEMQWDFGLPRRAPARPEGPAKNARFANTQSPAVQHDGSSGGTAIRGLESLAPGSAAEATESRLACPPQPSPGTGQLRNPASHDSVDATARLMLVGVCLAWGTTWPALKIALDGIPPFSMRVGTCVLGAGALFGIALLRGRDVRVHGAVARVHLVVAGCLNVAMFTVFTAFAQLVTTTSRVAVVSYTMPIWAALFARFVLGERLTPMRGVSLGLCVAGLSVLIYPLLGSSDLFGLALALGTGVSWAIGTVYLKWARLEIDPLALAAWQVTVALVASIAGLLVVEGSLHLWPADPKSLVALVYSGLAGSAVAYLLWFEIVRRLPAMTASLGALGSPVVGVIGSVLVLGERLTLADATGFALIFAAAACVLLTPTSLVDKG